MLLFGHLGSTLAFTGLVERLTDKFNGEEIKPYIDYRLILFGAMLPDIIDKPLVLLISSKPMGSARFIAHSLSFVIVFMVIGIFDLLMHKRQGVLLLSFTSMAHLVEDMAWKNPKVFLWPFYNWILHNINRSQPAMKMIGLDNRIEIITKSISRLDMKTILLKPDAFIPEVIGGLIIIYFLIKLMINNKLIHFIKTGSIRIKS
jgi:inner membrane protein